MTEKSEKTLQELKSFGFVMALVLLCISGLFLWKGIKAGVLFSQTFLILFVIASLFLLLAIFCPGLLRPIERYWLIFGEFMGSIMTRVILSLFFFLLLAPFAMILRLFGKKFLDVKIDPQATTYWKPVDQKGSASRHFLPY
ncbi:MAG TPA: SxtJ family membrane protein [Oligoflexia bacterium]|nr:SxtJ family membrane protein [Oligoflexia bacterium]HMP49447.1 SxtJ family membrane protein [Oligoflexia bacterium]